MRILHLFVVTLSILFIGCSSSAPAPKDPTAMPSWVMQPNVNGKTGAIGVAGRTYDQSVSSQRKLAIKRALDELSMQQNVKVELSMHKEEIVTNSETHLRTRDNSRYTASNVITAHIQEIWVDKYSKELYVWMVLDK